MSRTFTKLFSSITESTVWCEPDRTRLVWIAMLAMADHAGRVWSSVPGLANRARVPLEDCEVALETFLSPDPYSRTPDFEGRRIEPIDGGWRLLNHAKYRNIRDEESIKESKRRYINGRRAAEREGVEKCRTESNVVDRGRANAEAEAVKDQKLSSSGDDQKVAALDSRLSEVTKEAVETWNASDLVAGGLPSIRIGVGFDKRKSQVRRMLQTAREICLTETGTQTITRQFWVMLWSLYAQDEFYAGRGQSSRGHDNWKPDFEFLTRPATVLKLYDKTVEAEHVAN